MSASPHLDAAVTVRWPSATSAADATHVGGVIFRVANSASSGQATAADIPVNCRGAYWRLLSVGANVQFGFILRNADTGATLSVPTLVYNQTSATGTGNLAAQPTIIDGIPEQVFCPPDAVRVVFISSAASGNFEACLSGKKTDKTKFER